MKNNRVRMRIPGEATTLIGPTGDQVTVRDEADGRVADLLVDDARRIIFSGLPECVAWRELNPSLVKTLDRPSPQHPGIKIEDLQLAAEMSRPVNPFDKASIARLALAGRYR